jgi:hypothetical protein
MRHLASFVCFPDQYEPYPEFESHSLRQSFCDQRSPPSFGALKSPITTGFARKPPHCAAPGEPQNSLSRPVCLQTSRLRGFNTVIVSY